MEIERRVSSVENMIGILGERVSNVGHRIGSIEAAILKHMEHEEIMTEKVTRQLAKLNHAVIVIIVTLFLTLGGGHLAALRALF